MDLCIAKYGEHKISLQTYKYTIRIQQVIFSPRIAGHTTESQSAPFTNPHGQDSSMLNIRLKL